MPNMVITNDGKVYFNDTALGVSAAENLIFYLYTNNYTPVDGSTLVNFTLATFAGSAGFTVLTTDWPGSVIVANVAVNTLATPPSWTHGGGAPQTVYGWVAKTAVSGLAVMAQLFTTSYVMSSGATIALDPADWTAKSIP